MKKRTLVFLLFGLVFALLISNIPVVSDWIGVATGAKSLHSGNPQFSSGNGGFRASGEYFGGSEIEKYNDLMTQFSEYKSANPKDIILYRHFRTHPLQFWNWYRYLLIRASPFYELPYREYSVNPR